MHPESEEVLDAPEDRRSEDNKVSKAN
jgi:hypothetical protein